MAEKRDFYEVLGVDRNADDAALKKAYRNLAKKYHPDSHPGDKAAEEKFKEASEAYAVLSDPEKRRQYDQFGMGAFDGNGAGGAGGFDFSGMDFGDIFGDLFGGFGGFGGFSGSSAQRGPHKGANVHAAVRISFKEAVFGVVKELDLNLKEECPSCHGSGCKPGTGKKTCAKCGGKGRVVMTQQSMFGTMQNVTTCPDCGGSGQVIENPCPDCHGSGYVTKRKRIQVNIPAGIDNGQSVRIRDKGEPGTGGGPRGDLLVEVRVSAHPIFQRNGYDLYSSAPITYAQAAIGSEVEIDTIDGKVLYTVKAGTQTDTRIRLRGKGVPSLRNKNVRGDHYVTLVVQTPTHLSEEAKEALRQFDALSDKSLSSDASSKPRKKGFREKMQEMKDRFDDAME